MRILQVLPELKGGGVERGTMDMAEALRKRFPVTYVASQGGMLVPELEAMGGTHFTLPLASKNPFQMLRNAFSLAQLIRKNDIQVLHARSRAPAWSTLWAAHWTKIPLVTTYHGAYPYSNSLKKFYNSVMVRGNYVIAISEFIANYIKAHHKINHSKIRLVCEGINLETFNLKNVSFEEINSLRKAWDIPDKATVILLPGRITRLKGQNIFLKSFSHFNYSNAVGVILGREKPGSTYTQEITQNSKGLPIRRIPHLQDPRTAYALADIVINTSNVPEAFGRVTAEAGAMERIVIATNLGATPELCQDGITGYLIPPDDPAALAQAIAKTINLSPESRFKMGKAARAHMEARFSLQRMCQETIDLYQELIA